MTLDQLLVQLGIGITSNAIYGFLTDYFARYPNTSQVQLRDDLSSFLKIEGANIKAEKIITFLAERGDIVVKGTQIYTGKSVRMFSSPGTHFTLGNNSSSSTDKTRIVTEGNSQIVGQGGAGISQDEDGSIRFYT